MSVRSAPASEFVQRYPGATQKLGGVIQPQPQGGGAMQRFTQSLGFIVFFIVAVLLLSMTLGDKATMAFLWLVLFSMVILNSGKISDLLGRFTTG